MDGRTVRRVEPFHLLRQPQNPPHCRTAGSTLLVVLTILGAFLRYAHHLFALQCWRHKGAVGHLPRTQELSFPGRPRSSRHWLRLLMDASGQSLERRGGDRLWRRHNEVWQVRVCHVRIEGGRREEDALHAHQGGVVHHI